MGKKKGWKLVLSTLNKNCLLFKIREINLKGKKKKLLVYNLMCQTHLKYKKGFIDQVNKL